MAYALTGERYRRQVTDADFARQVDNNGEITVKVAAGKMEGAAGSSYYAVPTIVSLSDSKVLAGTTVLRRVNDVPGATQEQPSWRIEVSNLSNWPGSSNRSRGGDV